MRGPMRRLIHNDFRQPINEAKEINLPEIVCCFECIHCDLQLPSSFRTEHLNGIDGGD